MDPITALENRLTKKQKQRLRSVWAPQTVGCQPSTTWGNLCMMPDGELRYYGHDQNERIFLSSLDAGISWTIRDVPDRETFCAGVQCPWNGLWVSSCYAEGEEGGWQNTEVPALPPDARGWEAILSEEGPGGKARFVHISNEVSLSPRFPLCLKKRRRVLICANAQGEATSPVVAYADDDLTSWHTVTLKPVPPHEVIWPHESVRWQNGSCEATILEREDGSLVLYARTSLDHHYMYESFDGGESWTDPVPSCFHATLTMPTVMKMQNGTSLFFFCCTQPLPECTKNTLWPPLNASELAGKSEDVFTNRDANHAAISFDDGKTWKGFRELYLTDIRNEPDFRTKGGNPDERDRSIHQFQALELPYGKILLAFGQHYTARRMILFDPGWLLETENTEDLSSGFSHLSTQVYYKSVSGNMRSKSGHCAWNRTSGAILLPDPTGNFEEAIYLKANADERLYSPLQGVCWNFPAAKKGHLTVLLRPGEEGLRVSLTDRWFNPCDRTVPALSVYSATLFPAHCDPVQAWNTLEMIWTEKFCRLVMDGREWVRLHPGAGMPVGLNYVIFQSSEVPGDRSGSYIKYFHMTAVD